MCFTSRDWSEEIGSGNPTPITLSKPHEVVLKEELRFSGPIPTLPPQMVVKHWIGRGLGKARVLPMLPFT